MEMLKLLISFLNPMKIPKLDSDGKDLGKIYSKIGEEKDKYSIR